MVEYSPVTLDRIFSAVSDGTRRAILESLAEKPATITELASPFAVSLNAVSKHVMVLERAGLIRREINGREHWCWLEPQPLCDATVWLDHYRQFWNLRLNALENYVARKAKTKKTGGAHAKSY
jgi:DNA-binding transcriptional ArsR family regulator